MSDEQIKQMVNRFLSWKLPEDFMPDGGISFKKIDGFSVIGTNLFDATQATTMVKHMVEGLPNASPIDKIECSVCGGTGEVLTEIDTTKIMYGDYEIGKDWTKVDNVWIWFQAFNRDGGWRGIPGYVYDTESGYVAPFRGKLIPVIKDTKNEYRESEPTQSDSKDKQ